MVREGKTEVLNQTVTVFIGSDTLQVACGGSTLLPELLQANDGLMAAGHAGNISWSINILLKLLFTARQTAYFSPLTYI